MPGLAGALDAGIGLAEVDAAAELERGLEIVVDDELGLEIVQGTAELDDLRGRRTLQPQLHDGRTACRGGAGRLRVGHERVDPHETFARPVSELGIERREGVVERDMEAARALRLGGRVLPGDAEGDERLDRGFERVVLAGEEAARQRRRHAAGARDRREQLVPVRDRGGAIAVGDVVDRAGDGRDDAERPRGCAGELGGIAAAADRLDPAHLGLDPDERRDLAGVPAQDRHVDDVEDPLRGVGAVRGRAGPDGVEDDRDRRARSPPCRRAASPRSSPRRACRC